MTRDDFSVLYKSGTRYNGDDVEHREPLIAEKSWDLMHYTRELKKMTNIFYEKVITAPVDMICSSASFWRLH